MHQLNTSPSRLYHEHPGAVGKAGRLWVKQVTYFQNDTIRRVLIMFLMLLHRHRSDIRPFSWSFSFCSPLLCCRLGERKGLSLAFLSLAVAFIFLITFGERLCSLFDSLCFAEMDAR